MSTRLLLGNLPIDVNEESLQTLLGEEKSVSSISIKLNGAGRPLGFALVEIEGEDAVARVVSTLSNSPLAGRQLSVSVVQHGSHNKRNPFGRWFGRN
jgi:RNA recognition motif-containing protein